MKVELNKTNNEISELKRLPKSYYESIFKMFKTHNYYGFNILKKVEIPSNINSELVAYTRIAGKISWQQLSYNVYGTIHLWWLICVTNKILNPVQLPQPGTIIKIIKPEYVNSILDEIENKINKS